MSFPESFLELIASPSGALAYHLVTLFAIQLILGVAVGHWRRWRDEAATRLLVMAIGVFLARVVLMLLAVVDSAGLIASTVVLPPLERFLHLITVVFAVWAFLPVLEQNRRLGTVVLLLALVVASGTYAAFASLWSGAEAQGISYNATWQERVWHLSTAGLLGLGLIASLVWRAPDWAWVVCLLAVWLIGHVLQLLAPTVAADTPGWVRLANLAALPLLAALVFRRALGSTAYGSGEVWEGTPDAAALLAAVQHLRAGNGLETGLDMAVSPIARSLDADTAVIGLVGPEDDESLRIVARHLPSSRKPVGQKPTLELSKHPVLAAAYHGQRMQVTSAEPHEALGVVDLYRRLGYDRLGPLLVQPLTTGGAVLGLLLAGNPDSHRAWTPRDQQVLQAAGFVLASAIASGDYGDRVSES